MTKDVLITISGIQMIDEEDSDVEMIVRGDYYQKNGKHYILYEEMMEGFTGKVKNVIKISPSGMDIIKKGIAKHRGGRTHAAACGPAGRCAPPQAGDGRRTGQSAGECGLFPGY